MISFGTKMLLLETNKAEIETQGRNTSITGPFLVGDVVNKNKRLYPSRVLGQHLLRGDLHRLRTQVEALDLDLATDRPEGVPTRRQPLHQPALDVEETGLVVLDQRASGKIASGFNRLAILEIGRVRLGHARSVPRRGASLIVCKLASGAYVHGDKVEVFGEVLGSEQGSLSLRPLTAEDAVFDFDFDFVVHWGRLLPVEEVGSALENIIRPSNQ
jgi:hypothetical protein